MTTRSCAFALLLAACTGTSAVTTTSNDAASIGDGSTTVATADAGANDAGFVSSCGTGEQIDEVVCAANAFLATLSSTELSAVNLSFTDSTSRTKWSNLPGVTRAGMKVGSFTNAQSKPAALAMMSYVLTAQGQVDLVGVMHADDYLAAYQSGSGGGGPGGAYGAANYTVAIFGTPSATGSWAIAFGGHHMAYNITYLNGVAYPVPAHLGVEPKYAFEEDGVTYEPLADESAALQALYGALDTDQLSTAYLSGQTFSDVVLGPLEYGQANESAVTSKYPTGASRTGVAVSALTSVQQALVTTAIEAWVADYAPAISDGLVADYTSSAAYADTLVSWGGTQSAGPDVDVSGTYFRIDGPRLWIEVACQNGVVIQGTTHFHTIYRDKQYDYGASLSQ